MPVTIFEHVSVFDGLRLHGASLHAELELLVEAGMTPIQALTSATSAPLMLLSCTTAVASGPVCGRISFWLTAIRHAIFEPRARSRVSGKVASRWSGLPR